MDERKKSKPKDQIANDGQLKQLAGNFLFDLYNELELSRFDNRVSEVALDLALSRGKRFIQGVINNMETTQEKEFWFELYVALKRQKDVNRQQVLNLIPLRV